MTSYIKEYSRIPCAILTFLFLANRINRISCQICVTTVDCVDSGTTCQDVDIPTKSGTTYGTRIEKRCICTEGLRMPCYEDADCTQRYSGLSGVVCLQSLGCIGQVGIGYCRIASAVDVVDLRKLNPRLM